MPDPTFPTTIPLETVAALERVEREAYVDLYTAAPAEFLREFGIEFRRLDDGFLMISRTLDHIMFDRVQGLGVERPARAEAVDEAVAAFGKVGVKNWIIQLAPGADALAPLLAERGFLRHPRTWAKFVYGADAPPAARTGLSIREIGSEHTAAFGEIACAAFELPPNAARWIGAIVGRPRWRTFLAFDGEKPVAAGTVFIDGKASWLGFGSTLASHRGRGAQGAILAARIRTSMDAGANLISTETGIPHEGEAGPSFKNIQRAGFKIVYERPNMRRV